MNRVVIVVPIVLACAGCLLPLGGGEVGELKVGWRFGDDLSCAAVGVSTVSVQVTSDEAGGGVDADCVSGSAVVPDLPPGAYDILLDAVGAVAWTGREEIEVEAGFTSDEGIVLLKPASPPSGARATLLWTFGGTPSCNAVGVDVVEVIVREGGALLLTRTVPCADGGVTLAGLPATEVQIELRGSEGGVVVYQATTNAIIGLAETELGAIDLLPVRARIDLAWTFADDPRCEVAGVTDVSVQVIDDDGVTVAGAQADCLSGHLTLAALPAEHLTFVVEGTANGARRFANSVALTLDAGDNPGLTLSLEPAFARAHVRWRFADAAGTADCAAAGVASVSVQVFDAGGAAVAGGTFACALGVGVIEDLGVGAHRFVSDGFSSAGVLVAQETTGNPRGVTQTLVLGDNTVDVTLE